jgi:hypothetical protein
MATRVKSFDAEGHANLEKQINDWLEGKQLELIDIKIATKDYHYWALVIYKPL